VRHFSLLLTAVLASFSCAHADVIAGDLGPGDSFQTGSGNAWATGGPDNSENAVSFVVPTGQNYILDQILVADNWFSGGSSLTVGIYSGADPNTAPLLESFSIPANTTPAGTGVLFTLPSVTTPTLVGGRSYLIEESIGDCAAMPSCGTTWGWQWNNLTPAQTGYFSLFPGGSWFPETGITPAFEVTGTPVTSAVPEPGFIRLLAAAGALLGLSHLRKKPVRA
jgi:hypothetical protein